MAASATSHWRSSTAASGIAAQRQWQQQQQQRQLQWHSGQRGLGFTIAAQEASSTGGICGGALAQQCSGQRNSGAAAVAAAATSAAVAQRAVVQRQRAWPSRLGRQQKWRQQRSAAVVAVVVAAQWQLQWHSEQRHSDSGLCPCGSGFCYLLKIR